MSSYVCPVCRDLLTDPREIEKGTKRDDYHPVVTYCGHMFHLHCLMKWFMSLRERGRSYSCPTCFENIMDLDVVRMYPASDDKFEDYLTLLKRVQKQARDFGILTGELEFANASLHAATEMVARDEEKVEQMRVEIQRLQLLVNSNNENVLLEAKNMKSVHTETMEQPSNYDRPKNLGAALKAINFESIAKYVQILVNDNGNSNAATTRPDQRHPVSYIRGRNPKKGSNYEEIVKKLKNIFTSRNVFAASGQPFAPEEEIEVIGNFIPGFSYQIVLMSRSITADTEEASLEVVKSNRGCVKAQNLFVLYLHRGKAYSPGFELFQLQLATSLRILGIHHTFQVLHSEANKVPIMKFGDQEIFEPDICCAIMKWYFAKQAKKHVRTKRLKPKPLTLIKNILDTSILWGLLLWQWDFGEGKSMKIFPRKHSSEFSAALKQKLRTIAGEKVKSYLDKATLLRQVTNDLKIISKELGNKKYFSGPLPGETDASVYVLLSQLLWNSEGSPLHKEVSKHENLVAFVIRLKDQFWPEWEIGSDLPHLWN